MSPRFEHPPADVGELLLTLVNSLDAMLAYWDCNQVCVFANDAYLGWFGKTSEEMTGITLEQLLGPIYAKNLPYIRAAYEGKPQVFEREIPVPAGGIRYSLAKYMPHVVDGKVQGIFVHVADVTPLKLLENELRAAKDEAELRATHDYLTGLPNRVLLADRITQALANARRTHQHVAGLSLDLDDFKEVNDKYGHQAGDRLLIEIAERLKRSVREFDTVTRMGGDEFFLLLPAIESRAQAEAMASRIIESINQPFHLGDVMFCPTCSIGIAISTPSSTNAEPLITESDQALYVAKRLGKNRHAFVDSAVRNHEAPQAP